MKSKISVNRGRNNFFDDPEVREARKIILGRDPTATLIIGHCGTGKTTLAASYDSPYWFCFDNKVSAIPKKQIDKVRTFNYGEPVHSILTTIMEDMKDIDLVKELGVKTVIIDTVTSMCTYLEAEILRDKNLNPKGASALQLQHYNIIGTRIIELINVCKEAGLDLVMLSHIDEILDDDQEMICHPNVTGKKLETKLAGQFDNVMYTMVEKDKYLTRIKSSPKYPHAKLGVSKKLNKLLAPRTVDLTYKKLCAIMSGSTIKK